MKCICGCRSVNGSQLHLFCQQQISFAAQQDDLYSLSKIQKIGSTFPFSGGALDLDLVQFFHSAVSFMFFYY